MADEDLLFMLKPVYEGWMNGTLSTDHALQALCCDLGEVESQIEPLIKEKEALRDKIAHIVAAAGYKVTVPGYKEVAIISPSKSASYDRALVDSIMAHLAAEGHPAAAELAQARKETHRAGSLRMVREKHPA